MSRSETNPNVFHKLLFRWFRSAMVQLAYREPRPKKGQPIDRLEFCFYDKQGRAYYRFKNDDHIPIIRKLYLANAYTRLVTAISDQDISVSLLALNKALHETDAKGRMQPNIARIGYICQELLSRRGFLIRMDLLRDLAANYFIREDEKVDDINDITLVEKGIALSELDEVVKQFFYEKGIYELFPFLSDAEKITDDILAECTRQTEAFKEELKKYTDGLDIS